MPSRKSAKNKRNKPRKTALSAPSPREREEFQPRGGGKPVFHRFAKPALFRLAAVSLAIVLALSVVEGAVRVLGVAPPLPEQYRDFIDDPSLSFRKKPNIVRSGTSASKEYDFEYRTNSQGFRDDEHAFDKPEGVFRILAVGDSFTWGIGAPYEDTYLYQLEAALNSRGRDHPKVEIIKAGVPRYFPEIQRLLLEQLVPKYDPDMVLAAFLPNDVIDTALGIDALKPTSAQGYLLSKRARDQGPIVTALYLHSHLARVVMRTYIEKTGSTRESPARLQEMTDQQWRAVWDEVRVEYERMAQLAHGHDVPFVLIHIPQADLEPSAGRNLDSIMHDKVDAFIDTQPDLKTVRDTTGKALYWPKDGHCDADGYKVIADSLFRELTARNLVP